MSQPPPFVLPPDGPGSRVRALLAGAGCNHRSRQQAGLHEAETSPDHTEPDDQRRKIRRCQAEADATATDRDAGHQEPVRRHCQHGHDQGLDEEGAGGEHRRDKARMLDGKPPRKVIIVPDRIVNVVV